MNQFLDRVGFVCGFVAITSIALARELVAMALDFFGFAYGFLATRRVRQILRLNDQDDAEREAERELERLDRLRHPSKYRQA